MSLLRSRVDEEFGAGVFSLVNAATIGWGAGDYVAFVEDFGEEVNPDVILVSVQRLLSPDRTLFRNVWQPSAESVG